jgi:sarcosine oxidase subunit alpha
MVRHTVGVCDVSTLGKIDIQGLTPAASSISSYANTFSDVAVGQGPLRG